LADSAYAIEEANETNNLLLQNVQFTIEEVDPNEGCTETDAENSPYVQGFIELGNGLTAYDFCHDSHTVYEFTCSVGYAGWDIIPTPCADDEICHNGVCYEEEETIEEPMADLVVEDINITGESFLTRVCNIGDKNITEPFDVAITIAGNEFVNTISGTIVPLDNCYGISGGSVGDLFELAPGDYNSTVEVFADSGYNITESDEDNNILMKTIEFTVYDENSTHDVSNISITSVKIDGVELPEDSPYPVTPGDYTVSVSILSEVNVSEVEITLMVPMMVYVDDTTEPGSNLDMTGTFDLEAGEPVTHDLTLTIPENVVPGIANLGANVIERAGDIQKSTHKGYELNITTKDEGDDYNTSDSNVVPVLEFIEDVTVNENESMEIQLNASDADNHTLSFSSDAAFGNLDAISGLFTWTPGFNDSGNYSVNFTVTDSEAASDSRIMNIEVIDVFINESDLPDTNSTNNDTNSTDDSGTGNNDDGSGSWDGDSDEDEEISLKMSMETKNPEEGDEVEFEITVKNKGDLDLEDVELTLEFDEDDWNFKDCSDSCDDEDDKLEWDEFDLKDGEDEKFTVKLKATSDGETDFTVKVIATDEDGNDVIETLSVTFDIDEDDDNSNSGSSQTDDYQQYLTNTFAAVDDGSWQPSETSSTADVLSTTNEATEDDMEVVLTQPRMMLVEEKVCKFRLFWIWCIWWDTTHTYVPVSDVAVDNGVVAQPTGAVAQDVAQTTVEFSI